MANINTKNESCDLQFSEPEAKIYLKQIYGDTADFEDYFEYNRETGWYAEKIASRAHTLGHFD